MEEHIEPELIDVADKAALSRPASNEDSGKTKSAIGLALVCLIAVLGLRMVAGPAADAESDSETESSLGGSDGVEPDGQAQPDTTSVHSNPRVFDDRTRRVDEGDRFFEFATGWDLVIGGFDADLISIPLDGGKTVDLESRGTPVLAVGDWLLLGGTGRLRRLDLSEPGSSSSILFETSESGFAEIGAIPGPEENQVWLVGGDFDHLTWQLWEIGEEAEMLTELAAAGKIYFGFPAHPELASPPSGGVFEISEGAEPTQVADGRLLAVTGTHAVVQQCETPFECEALWLRRSDWQVDPNLISPDGLDELAWAVVQTSADGERALVSEYRRGTSTLWNLLTGEVEHEGFQSGAALSPDGRFLAGVRTNGALFVADLETGESTQSKYQNYSRYNKIVFVKSR